MVAAFGRSLSDMPSIDAPAVLGPAARHGLSRRRPARFHRGGRCAGVRRLRRGDALGFDITMAFQPIVDIASQRVFGYEALVRGLNGESAAHVLARVNDDNRYAFDQRCRTRAIELAWRHGIVTGAETDPAAVDQLPAERGLPSRGLHPGDAEGGEPRGLPARPAAVRGERKERTLELSHLKDIFEKYRALGFRTAIDDFGAGHSGLALLVELQPDIVKVDMALIRGIERSAPRQAVLRALVGLCGELDIGLIAEGVETREETLALRDLGVRLFQGYFFGRPLVREPQA
jgi:EAL domain-containing protein (putative c-di-GMP-specific phosphodiesterase class I)